MSQSDSTDSRVEDNLGIQTPKVEEHNIANRILLEGARRLGYAIKVVPQNIAGSFGKHAKCGAHCTLGCRIDDGSDECGGKMSGCRFALGPLSKAKGGVTVRTITDFEVDRVVWSERDPDVAIGAIGHAIVNGSRRKVLIKADRTVVAAGTMQTPAVLLRSGLRVSDTKATLTSEPAPWSTPAPSPRHDCAFYLAHQCEPVGRHHPHHGHHRAVKPGWGWTRRQD